MPSSPPVTHEPPVDIRTGDFNIDPDRLDPHWVETHSWDSRHSWGSWNELVKEKMRVKEIKTRLRAEGYVGLGDVQANVVLDGWKPMADETEADAVNRVNYRVKEDLGELEGEERTWGTVPMPTMTVSLEVSAPLQSCKPYAAAHTPNRMHKDRQCKVCLVTKAYTCFSQS